MEIRLRKLNVPDVRASLVLLLVIGEKARLMLSSCRDVKWIYDQFAVIVKSSGGDTQASYWDETYSQPYFDNSTRRDLTVTIGQTALLHCRVRNLGDRAVSPQLFFSPLHSKSIFHCGSMQLYTQQHNEAAKEAKKCGAAVH